MFVELIRATFGVSFLGAMHWNNMSSLECSFILQILDGTHRVVRVLVKIAHDQVAPPLLPREGLTKWLI